MKNDEIKNLVSQIESGETSLEDILKNNDFIQPTIKNKFVKFSKFFKKEWINKLINYSLNYSKIDDYPTLSHNSTEILALVKSSHLAKELTKCEDNNSENKDKKSGKLYPYLDKIFEYLDKKVKDYEAKSNSKSFFKNNNSNKSINNEMDIENEEIFSEEMLNGYFERILLNLLLKRKKKVSFY